jgi:hypothetical protein
MGVESGCVVSVDHQEVSMPCDLSEIARRVGGAVSFASVFLAGLFYPLSAMSDEVPVRSVVRFNTVCANCHEGQCSGRLSFESGAEAARGHMQRYLGPLSDEDIHFLFSVLRHTKEQCSHYPVGSAVAVGQEWTEADLDPWRNPQEGAYFVPLGEVKAGRYRLQVVFAAPAQARVRITDVGFEPIAEVVLCAEQPAELSMELPAGSYYLTLHSPQQLKALKLSLEAP